MPKTENRKPTTGLLEVKGLRVAVAGNEK